MRFKFPPAAAVADREIDFFPGQIGVLQIGDPLNAEVSRMPFKSRIRGSNQNREKDGVKATRTTKTRFCLSGISTRHVADRCLSGIKPAGILSPVSSGWVVHTDCPRR